MDSCSGSMQSSSGGDEEYDDSRAESISAFLNTSTYVASMANQQPNQLPLPPPPPPPSQQQSHYLQIPSSSSSSMFDPLTNYFDSLSSRSSPNSLLNLDTVWYKNMRSDPNCTDVGGFNSTSVTNQQQSLQNRGGYPPYGQQQMMALHGGGGVGDKISAANIEMGNTHNNNKNQNNNIGVRNPKKRSRASRRAPTTVLTTDTSSFRAMVQEFTGIPAPPFTSSSSLFPRTRFDFFSSPSPPTTSFRPLLDPSHPPYLLRPFPQKLNPPIIAPTTTTNPFSSSSSSTTPFLDSMNQLHPHQPLTSHNFTNSLNNSTLASLPAYKMGILEEFGLTRPGTDNLTNTTNWCGSGSGSKVREEEEDEGKEREDVLRPVVKSYNSNNGKAIYSDSLAQGGGGFHGENVTASGARTEGMVESWISSSD